MADCRSYLARLLDRQGEQERARALIVANARTLDDSPLAVSDPRLVVRRVLAHEDLRRFNDRDTSVSRVSVGTKKADALSRLLSSDADRMSAEVWAELFARVLGSTTANVGTSPSLESEAEYFLTDLLGIRCADRRRSGDLEEARRTAERMRSVSSLLVSRHPDQAAAHLALSRAFEHIAKNAWQINDRAAIEQYWKLAIDETRRALLIDPQHARCVAKLKYFSSGSKISWHREERQ